MGPIEQMCEWVPQNLNLTKRVLVRAAGRDLILAQDTNTSMCGHVVWEVAVIVAKLLDAAALPLNVVGRTVLELGSGCGLTGMVFGLHGASVTLTDVPALKSHLEANVLANLGPKQEPISWDVVDFDWNDPPPLKLQKRWDVVVGTDCVYHAHLVEPFLSALRAVTTPTSTLLLVYERRDPDVIADFEAALKRAFKVRRPLTGAKLKAILGDILTREDDDDWLTVLVCRRKKTDYAQCVRPT